MGKDNLQYLIRILKIRLTNHSLQCVHTIKDRFISIIPPSILVPLIYHPVSKQPFFYTWNESLKSIIILVGSYYRIKMVNIRKERVSNLQPNIPR